MADSSSERPTWGTLTSSMAQSNEKWWPDSLNLKILHQRHPRSNPMGEDFDYGEAFEELDLEALTADLDALMTDSQEWWPADWGHYGPLFIRMAWHAAGTYRQHDGRGGGGTGAQRFAPLNSWPDNGNLDKARRLLWPIKKKYGQQISWADLFIYAGNRALATMGFEPLGFGGGREDIYAPEDDIYWGPEDEWLGDERYSGERELDEPLAAVQMGLIYVNPEGPNGVPDALKQAKDLRDTFTRMAMNDEETVALTVGGHTFGKMHGAAPDSNLGPEPEKGMMEDQGLGWTSEHGTGKGADTITSGLEGAWTPTPIEWDNSYLDLLFKYEWEVVESPAGAKQWEPKGEIDEADMVPDAHIEGKMNKPVMNTADMAMVIDPGFLEISKRFHENPDELYTAFQRAWFKLTHRDMGPKDRYRGPLVPEEDFIWQDPVPAVDHELVDDEDVAGLKQTILESGLTVQQLVSTAWAAASTYRTTDKRGGANGARIRLEPQASWDVNVRAGVGDVVSRLEEIQAAFNAAQDGDKRISLADTIVLGGCAAVEQAAADAGHDVTVPFTPGRTDATQEQTDVDSFQYLEPKYDGFRNYQQSKSSVPTEHLLVDKAFMLELSAPEMTALVGGMRALGANIDGADHGVLTDRVGQLTNDFFTNLLDMGTKWTPVDSEEVGERQVDSELFEGVDRASGEQRWTATRADLVFGSNSQLRAIAEVYGADDAEDRFVGDFVAAFAKVMELDRFDIDR